MRVAQGSGQELLHVVAEAYIQLSGEGKEEAQQVDGALTVGSVG
jgi:hypothetical protein